MLPSVGGFYSNKFIMNIMVEYQVSTVETNKVYYEYRGRVETNKVYYEYRGRVPGFHGRDK